MDIEFIANAVGLGVGIGGAVGSVGVGLGIAKAALRAGGQWGADYDLQRAALDAQVALEQARATAASAAQSAAASATPRTYSPQIHYAPHFGNGSNGAAASAAASAELPGIVDLADMMLLLQPGRVLLGVAAGGATVSVSMRELMHVGISGATGGGKSSIARLLLTQILAGGAGDVWIANPHWVGNDADDPQTGDWRPIGQRATVAWHAEDISEMFTATVEIVNERWQRKRDGYTSGRPLILFVDEFPNVKETVAGAADMITSLIRRGRAVGVYVLTATQDFLTKTTGLSSGARENFRTGYYSGGDPSGGRVLLDMRQSDIPEERLGRGVALLRSAATTPPQLVRIPLVSNQALSKILANEGTGTDDIPDTGAVSGAVSTAPDTSNDTSSDTDELIRSMVRYGLSNNKIHATIGGNRNEQMRRINRIREEMQHG